jgi:hypothetical protein
MTMHPHPPDSDTTIHGLSAAAFASVFESIDGLRNRRALAAMLGCLAIGVLVAGLCTVMAARLGYFFAFLGGVAMFVAVAAGVNAAGVLLMDQARSVPQRPLGDAIVYGLMCIPKFAALALGLFLAAVAVFVVLAVLYAVCKIPLLGPILFVLVFPLSVVVAGVTLCGLFLGMFLALPAIWEGATITRAIAQTLAIARTRLVESVLLLVVVGLLAGVVGLIVFGVLFTGLMPAIGVWAAVLGGDGLDSMMGMVRHGSTGLGAPEGGATAGAYAIAAGIGSGLLWALAGSLVSLVSLLGLSLVYLRVTEGLDVGATETALRARLDDAKRQAAELGQRARDTAERAREQARRSVAAAQAGAVAKKAGPAPEPAAPGAASPAAAPSAEPLASPDAAATPPDASPAKAATCPQCLAPIGAADVFCGVCGCRLK